MDHNRWSIERSGDPADFPALLFNGDHVTLLSPERADSLEPLLNPLPTMTGTQIAAAISDGKTVMVPSSQGGERQPSASWVEAVRPFGFSVVARVVDPEPEPEPTWFSPSDRCPALAPRGHGVYSCSRNAGHDGDHAARPNHDLTRTDGVCWSDAPASVSADPLPEGVERLSDGTLVAKPHNLPEGWLIRNCDSWDGQWRWDDGERCPVDGIYREVRPIDRDAVETVDLAHVPRRTLPGHTTPIARVDWEGRRWHSRDEDGRVSPLVVDSSGLVTVLREDQL